jgi:hypothetical protein
MMGFEAKIKSTDKIIHISEYNPTEHKGRLTDKFFDIPVSAVKAQFRKGYPVQPHFRLQRLIEQWPDNLIFDPEYFKQREEGYSGGERWQHLLGKQYVAQKIIENSEGFLNDSMLRFEYRIKMPCDRWRIADVAFIMPYGEIFVFEIQLAAISIEELEARALSYLSVGVHCEWCLGLEALTSPNIELHSEFYNVPPRVLEFSEESHDEME